MFPVCTCPVEERFDIPHNRIEPANTDLLTRHYAGKRTLVFGIHQSAVRKSEEEANTCPNYWHLSPYGFCPYDCSYCYLAGTRSVSLSPTVKVFLNLPEMLMDIDRIARGLAEPTAFYPGKLQDALALDPLTGYSRILVPFFAQHPFARMTLLTKCSEVTNLLDLKHCGQTILSWSLNPPEIHAQFERNVPSPEARIHAMKQCADAGYSVRAVLMPMIPCDNWQAIYTRFVRTLIQTVPLQRLTMGGICSYQEARRLMDSKLNPDNIISANLIDDSTRYADYRARFSPARRIEMYQTIIECARSVRPNLDLALCLEDDAVMHAVGLRESSGRCNCVL